MNVRSNGSVQPIVQRGAEIGERRTVRVEALAVRAQYAHVLRREIHNLPEFLLALAQRLRELLLLRYIHPGSDEPPESPAVGCRPTDATDMTSGSIRPHNPFCEVEATMVCQHLPNFVRHEVSIIGVHERHIFRNIRRLAARLKAMDLKQPGRPVFKAGSVECPAAGVCKTLTFRQVELGPLSFFNIDVDANPATQRSIIRPARFSATKEPAISAFSVTHPKSHLTCGSRSDAF